MVKKWLMIAALSAVAFTPATASADWLFTPNLGATFGGSTSGSEHFTYGASIGWMGAGVFGWEADLAYTPEFFEGDDDEIDFIDGSNVTTAMFNAIVGAPVGGQFGPGFRPYFSGGIGLLSRERPERGRPVRREQQRMGLQPGRRRDGIRDRSCRLPRRPALHPLVRGSPFDDFDDTFDAGSFDYWRGTAGVTFRW